MAAKKKKAKTVKMVNLRVALPPSTYHDLLVAAAADDRKASCFARKIITTFLYSKK